MEKKKNRRKGPDNVSRFISLLVSASWVMIFALFVIIALAKPSTNMSIFTIMSENTRSFSGWNISLISLVFPVLLVQLGLCLFGLILSSRRMKRRRDKYSKSLIFFTIVSLAGLLVYFISFT
ncbi:MAG: hypothetical protein LBT84_05275 [Spirochaetia bacterium]|jgi:hypothetical protein|nr:hypothetical protein [Spirochaetia bacterium]